MVTRRDLLKRTAAAGAALTFGRIPALRWLAPILQEGEIRRRMIPSSGEQVPVVGLGTARTFDVGESLEERAPLRAVLRRFVELGGTLVDTAPGYGSAQSVLGDLGADLDIVDDLFMATKVAARGRDAGIQQMERSLQLLNRESVELMQVHNLVDWETQLAVLREWKEAGRIRYIGITTSRVSQYDDFLAVMESQNDLDFVQLNYNLGQRQAEERLLPTARDKGMAVLVNRPYQRARLFGYVRGRELPDWAAEFEAATWGQFFLKFILSHPAVTCVIPATSDPDHLADNMGAGYGALPDDAMRRRMVEFFESL